MTNLVQHDINYNMAVQDFRRARKQAALQQLMAKLTGKSVELLSYDEVHESFHPTGKVEKGKQEIPLEAIVGSVGRYEDFTRTFLPKHDSNVERWARVKTAVLDMKGWPPIDVYQVGEVYFVIDGNHRVSVARQLGSDSITAYVTEIKTRVPLTKNDDPNEVICKAQYTSFLEETNLDKLCPGCDFMMTISGYYDLLREEIAAHQRWMVEQKGGKPVAEPDAARSWYENVYHPIVHQIREQGIMHKFQKRTETDIYVLFLEHREEMEEVLGWEVDRETAVSDLVEQETERKKGILSRFVRRLRHLFVPPNLEDGPAPGTWRNKQLGEGRRNHLFVDFLVAFRGRESDWQMLDQIIKTAKRDNDRLLGLHVVSTKAEKNSEQVRELCRRFEKRCADADIVGEMAIEVGDIVDIIVKRAAWADIVVTSLRQPPADEARSRYGDGFIKLVQRCPQPILVYPIGAEFKMDRVLLAYDGSPKADEALFVATYLKTRWPLDLLVLTVETEHTQETAVTRAREYIEGHGIYDANYVLKQEPIAEAILETAETYQSNYLIMGGFGFRPVKYIMLGSTVEKVLQEIHHPVLICR
ncbi:MAG: universal stress protein [Chloroflexi bacterium]|nr:MAG: universal stress protein [Chloroflexota bacterium]